MIVKCLREHKIGEIISNGQISDKDGNWYRIPWKILREVSKEEFIRYCDGDKPGIIFDNDRFYEVSID